MLSFACSRLPPPPPPLPLAPFQGQKHNSFLSIGSRSTPTPTPTPNSIIVLSVQSKPRNIIVNVAPGSHVAVGEDKEDDELSKIALLREGLKPELMPKHVALIPDGHRRWAKERNLPFEAGHFAFRKPLELLFNLCRQLQIPVVSIYSLSTGNHSLRPKEQVNYTMKYLETALDYYVTEMFMREDYRLSMIGNKAVFPESVQDAIIRAEETTRNNKGLHVVSVVNYDGRFDIAQACKALADKAKDGLIQSEDIDEKLFEEQLQTKGIEYPNPDLFIRTSGTQRLGNYMLWQMAYSEICFVEKYHPEMREADYIRIFSDFQKRRRRFGG